MAKLRPDYAALESNALRILEQTTSKRGTELLNSVSDGHMTAVVALAAMSKNLPKEYARLTAAAAEHDKRAAKAADGKAKKAAPVIAPVGKGKVRAVITITVYDDRSEFNVTGEGLPEGFPTSGVQANLKKAKSIVSRTVYALGLVKAETNDE